MSSIAEQIPPEFIERFRSLTSTTVCDATSYPCASIVCTDPGGLGTLLNELGEYLAGIDLCSHPAVVAACQEAGVDHAELIRIPISTRDLEGVDLDKKESGDLGEVIAVLHLLAHHATDPRYLFAKNVLKLYERSSVPGVDAISIRLTGPVDAEELGDGEGMTLVESKASENGSLSGLAGDAVTSLAATTPHRMQKELLLIQAELRGRGEPTARLPLLLAAFLNKLRSVTGHCVLVSSTEMGTPHENDSVARYNAERPTHVSHLSVDVARLRATSFAFRRKM